MLRLPLVLTFVALVCAVAASQAHAAEKATASVRVNVRVASRTSLRVSSDVVRFDLPERGGAATAAISFSAGARVPAGARVVLTLEPLRHVEGPGGAADVEGSITFEGDGDGLLHGKLEGARPVVAARWQGSGLREGRLLFTLRSEAPGSYTLPVRFVLSTP
jgi:hypothetical protein